MGRVGRLRAVVRAMSFRACSAEVELLLALANCNTNYGVRICALPASRNI